MTPSPKIPVPAGLLALTNLIHTARYWHHRQRNGKVARLPAPVRDQINHMLEDGVPYRTIIARLQAANSLPWTLSEMNLSNWCHGGYRDWCRDKLKVAAGIPAASIAAIRAYEESLGAARSH